MRMFRWGTWDPQGSSVKGVHTQFIYRFPKESLDSDPRRGSGAAAKGVRHPLDHPGYGALRGAVAVHAVHSAPRHQR